MRRIEAANAVLMLCDVQTSFRPLDVPAVVTEQYPERLGATVGDIVLREGQPRFSKKQFSMLTEEVVASIGQMNRNSYIVCGIEAHVCVLQTVQGLLEHGGGGCNVYVVCDAVSSQRPHDRAVALQRLARLPNVHLTTAESVLFELMGSAQHGSFKVISDLVKRNNASCPNEFKNDVSL